MSKSPLNSFDPDHALAILLQAKFNEEAKKNKDKNKENLPVPISKPVAKASLIDPEWETTDPCPDIHGLFLAFNDRFFWGRLLTVEVKWSPQMTSCAGICVYEGRNGLCSVRLSAPLLKLRPRSDLVETLLHEMIHAYLFVTDNNRDRDGHGPEFHKHMYRINRDAGTHITVYHSFHAEVKLYQQHWWRCNGVCQHRAPFFGMVKRAKNRSPGPYDRWWADHQAACGGQFVKVREPEGFSDKKLKKEKKVLNDGKDIRNFFKKPAAVAGSVSRATSTSKVGSNVFGLDGPITKSASTADIRADKPSFTGNALNRVVGFSDLSKLSSGGLSRSGTIPPSGSGHVLGRGKKGSNHPTGSSSPRGGGRGRGGMLANRGGGTLVVTGRKTKSRDEPESPNTKLRIDDFKAFSGSGFSLGGANDRSKSRLLSLEEPKPKKSKTSDEKNLKSDNEDFSNFKDGDQMCKCSVCNKSIPREEVDVHLESCSGLQNVFNNSFSEDSGDEQEIDSINKKNRVTSCPVCALYIEGDLNAHLDECLNTSGILNVLEDEPLELSDCESPVQSLTNPVPMPLVDVDSDVELVESEDEPRVACPLCGMRFGESRINGHVNECLDSESDG